MYSQYAQDIAAMFTRLPKDMQISLAPLRTGLTQIFGRCDATLTQRGDIVVEGDPTITIGHNVTVRIKGSDGTLTAIDLTSTGASGFSIVYARLLGTPAKIDSNSDTILDQYPAAIVLKYIGANPGATVTVYDPGILETPAVQWSIGYNNVWAIKLDDGRYYAILTY